jgi:Tfp pilus assembly protein PilN
MKAVNLIPADQRRGAGGIAGRSGGIVYVVAGGLAVVVALGVLYAFAVSSVGDREGKLVTVTAQVSAVQAQAAALAPYVAVKQLRQSAVSNVVGLAEQRFDWPDAMAQLALALPRDVSLSTLSGSTAAGAVTGAAAPLTATPSTLTGAGAGFSLAGCASSQAEVATVLTRLAQVPGVTNVSLTQASKTGKAPNAGRPVARAKALAAGGVCPLVSFGISLSYDTSYTVPHQKLASTPTGSPQTLSTTIRSPR